MRRQTYRLRVPSGTDEVNSSSERFAATGGFVDVPSEMVEPLLRVGGCVLIGPTPDPEPVIPTPSAEFIAEVDAALATIAPPEAEREHPSAELVAEVVEAMRELAASGHHAAPAIPRLVIPT